MLKIRRPLGRLIFNMGIAIPGKTVFLIETAPWCHASISTVYQHVRFEEVGTYIFIFHHILTLIWRRWLKSLSPRKTNTPFPSTICILTADDLATPRARTSAALVWTPSLYHHYAYLLTSIEHIQWKIQKACVNACWVYSVESVSKMQLVLSVTFHIFLHNMWGYMC